MLESLIGRLRKATEQAESIQAAHKAASGLRQPAEGEDWLNGLIFILIGLLTVIKGFRLVTRQQAQPSNDEQA